jgi:uncharacterized repeat protein (TIGR01451 family)
MKGITGRSIRLVFYWLILFAFAQAFSTVLEPPVAIFADGGDEPPGVLEAAGFGPIVPEVPPVPVAFPELSLDLAGDLPEPQIGDHVTLTMTATNTGQATLRGYKIAFWLPPGLEFVQAGGNGSIVYNPGQRLVSAVPVPLPPGQTAALSFETVVDSGVEEYLLLTLSGSAPHLQRTAQAQLELHVVQNPGAGSGEDGLSDKLSLGLEPESGDSVGDGFDPAFKGGWSPQFNEPVVSTFSGAATYQYPIELPPGRNGLQPTLGLSYNSKRVDGLLQWQSSEWAGLGWNIETIDIVRTGIGEMWPGNPDFWLNSGFR